MPSRQTLSTALRVLTQLRHDYRTLGMLFLMPTVLLVVLFYVFEGNGALFDRVAPMLMGILPFTLMFIVTSVAVLRERTLGTLERLFTLPVSKLDILVGYALAFTVLAFVQSSITTFVTLTLLDVPIAGSFFTLLILATLAGVLGMAFGLLFSAFSKNEFQAVQFMPAFVLPQFLTCGLFTPRDHMANFLQHFSDAMPITYVVKALHEVEGFSSWTTELTTDVSIIIGYIALALILGAVSLRIK